MAHMKAPTTVGRCRGRTLPVAPDPESAQGRDETAANPGSSTSEGAGFRVARPSKGERIAVRASHAERELIAQASRLSATTLSDFVLRASIARAEDVLAERREFVLPTEQWNAFVAMLDRQPVDRPRLRRLLTEPSVLER